MTAALLALSFFISCVLGYLTVSIILRDPQSTHRLFWIRVFLGCGTGYGITSLVGFIWQVLGLDFGVWYFLFEFLLVLGLYVWWKKSTKNMKDTGEGYAFPLMPEKSFLFVSTIFVLFLGNLTFFIGTNVAPSGMWDAWMVQNRTARFLFTGGDQWTNAFSPFLVSADYPIFTGASVARLWRFIGHETIFGPAFLSLTMAASTVLLLISAVHYLRNKQTALLAGLIFLTSSAFLVFAPAQLADIPVSFFLLAAVVLLQIYVEEKPSHPRLLVLSGILSGVSMWTKNEGWIFTGAVFFAYFVLVPAITHKKIFATSAIFKFILGLLPVLAVILYFKFNLAPSHDFIRHQTGEISLWDKIADPARHAYLLQSFVTQLWDLTPDRSTPFIALILSGLLIGVKKKNMKNTGILAGISAMIIIAAGEYCIYLITPFDLKWQVSSSIHRLALQIWPVAVFTFCMLIDITNPIETKEDHIQTQSL